MAKPKTQFVCQNCGTVHSRWAGKCEGCGEWNTIVEEDPMGGIGSGPGKVPKKGRAVTLTALSGETEEAPRIHTGISELDRATGGQEVVRMLHRPVADPAPRTDRAVTAAAEPEWTPPSWEELVRDHSARVYRLAYRLTGNRPDAEDRPALPEAGADDLPDALPDGAAEGDALDQALPAGGDGEDDESGASPGAAALGPHAPDFLTTAARVPKRISTSRGRHMWSMYCTSRRRRSSKSAEFRPRSCQRPVMPGRTSRRRVCQRS